MSPIADFKHHLHRMRNIMMAHPLQHDSHGHHHGHGHDDGNALMIMTDYLECIRENHLHINLSLSLEWERNSHTPITK